MKKLLLIVLLLALTTTSQGQVKDLLTGISLAINKAVLTGSNNPVARLTTTEIIRPIHIYIALRNKGVHHVELDAVIEGVEYTAKYMFRGTVYRLTIINEGVGH